MISMDETIGAHFHGNSRPRASIVAVVLHSTEGETAKGAALWFANSASRGSAHVIVDDAHAFRTLADETIAYAAHPFNGCGLHLEIAGFARWSRAEWLAREYRLRRAAAVVAAWCETYSIPIEARDADDVRAFCAVQGKSGAFGITTHAAIVKGSGVGDHTDPGEGFPLAAFIDWTREQHARNLSREE